MYALFVGFVVFCFVLMWHSSSFADFCGNLMSTDFFLCCTSKSKESTERVQRGSSPSLFGEVEISCFYREICSFSCLLIWIFLCFCRDFTHEQNWDAQLRYIAHHFYPVLCLSSYFLWVDLEGFQEHLKILRRYLTTLGQQGGRSSMLLWTAIDSSHRNLSRCTGENLRISGTLESGGNAFGLACQASSQKGGMEEMPQEKHGFLPQVVAK